MIKAYVFDKKDVKVLKLGSVNVNRTILWVDVVDPTKEEISQISKKFSLPLSTINNCLDPEEMARVDNEENRSVIIFKAVALKNKQIKTLSLGSIISKRYILTIRKENVDAINKLSKNLDMKQLRKNPYPYILSQMLWRVTKEFFVELDKMEELVDKLENKLLRNNVIQVAKVFEAKKTLLYFKKALLTNRDVLLNLEKGKSPFVTRSSIEGLVRENLQLVDMEELIRGRVSEIANMHLTNVSNNLNVSMKYFAVIAALFLMPMLISGAYGMNFKVLPLATHPYGFWIMVGLMVASMTTMYLLFKRKDWI